VIERLIAKFTERRPRLFLSPISLVTEPPVIKCSKSSLRDAVKVAKLAFAPLRLMVAGPIAEQASNVSSMRPRCSFIIAVQPTREDVVTDRELV
jgi:hypothetical protein